MLTMDLGRMVRFSICQVGWARLRLRLIFRETEDHKLNLVESAIDGGIWGSQFKSLILVRHTSF